jgi:hypothetical protein
MKNKKDEMNNSKNKTDEIKKLENKIITINKIFQLLEETASKCNVNYQDFVVDVIKLFDREIIFKLVTQNYNNDIPFISKIITALSVQKAKDIIDKNNDITDFRKLETLGFDETCNLLKDRGFTGTPQTKNECYKDVIEVLKWDRNTTKEPPRNIKVLARMYHKKTGNQLKDLYSRVDLFQNEEGYNETPYPLFFDILSKELYFEYWSNNEELTRIDTEKENKPFFIANLSAKDISKYFV